jgi:DNA-binding GntR family transcriptional regulator
LDGPLAQLGDLTYIRRMGPQPRDLARESLEQRIISGELPGGLRLDEDRLAADLGVRREVLREALAGLERDGLTLADGDGFLVAPLDEIWLREAYPIALLLEGLAVRAAPPFDAVTLDRLRAINTELRELGPADARVAAERDFSFHDELVSACGNERLLETVRPMKRMLVRYERASMADPGAPRRSAAMHDVIIDDLARRDHEAAALMVEENFRSALPRLLAQVG